MQINYIISDPNHRIKNVIGIKILLCVMRGRVDFCIGFPVSTFQAENASYFLAVVS